ncbi:hypothetical protein AGMMS49941_12090 [Deferribacterales bacterium]|nr:hypothetical protein AGMMS49941_12090 [Deferribacterales bacterium]
MVPAGIVSPLLKATGADNVISVGKSVPAGRVTLEDGVKSMGRTAELTKDAPAETEMVLVSVTPADNIVPLSKSIWLAGV